MTNVVNSDYRWVRSESNYSTERYYYAKENDSLVGADRVEAGSIVYCSDLLGIPRRHVRYPTYRTTCS